jgi:hypothetical protein
MALQEPQQEPAKNNNLALVNTPIWLEKHTSFILKLDPNVAFDKILKLLAHQQVLFFQFVFAIAPFFYFHF